MNEEDVTDLVERYFAELARKKDSGSKLTNDWARFAHDDINIQRELRGNNNRQDVYKRQLPQSERAETERNHQSDFRSVETRKIGIRLGRVIQPGAR